MYKYYSNWYSSTTGSMMRTGREHGEHAGADCDLLLICFKKLLLILLNWGLKSLTQLPNPNVLSWSSIEVRSFNDLNCFHLRINRETRSEQVRRRRIWVVFSTSLRLFHRTATETTKATNHLHQRRSFCYTSISLNFVFSFLETRIGEQYDRPEAIVDSDSIHVLCVRSPRHASGCGLA